MSVENIQLTPTTSFDRLPLKFGSNHCPKRKRRRGDSRFIDQIVKGDFSKKYEFKWSPNYKLPDPVGMARQSKWKVKELQVLKEDLNAVKSKLNSYNLGDWHSHTRHNNHAGCVTAALKNFKIEFLTQAWCKFYETVSSYDLIPSIAVDAGCLNSVHLCEAPGAFIASLNHFLKSNHYEIEWKWLGTTLNPYYEGNSIQNMIIDDRFIINTIDNWWFGDDFTGNIHSEGYLEQFVKKTDTLQPIYLITADGSIDCLNDPAEQENIVVPLHYSETACALNILQEGGNFLLKMFTMFESDTICLMYLLRCAFRKIDIFKPVTSKEGNSEIYVICLDYRGKKYLSSHLDTLNKYCNGDCDTVLFGQDDIPKEFINDIISCAKKFKHIQVSVIERNISTYHNSSKKSLYHLKNIRECVAKTFLTKYKIKSIDESDFVVREIQDSSLYDNLFPRDESGSFLERQSFKNLNLGSMLAVYREKLSSFNHKQEWSGVISWLTLANILKETDADFGLSLKFGKLINRIQTSRFCKGNLLSIFIELHNLFLKEGEILKYTDTQLDKTISEVESCSQKVKLVRTHTDDWIQSYTESQKTFMEKLSSAAECFENDDTLVFKGFPLLSQFNIGLIYILGRFFERVGFVNPQISDYTVILNKLKEPNKLCFLIKRISDSICEGKSKALLSLVPVVHLFEKRFLQQVMALNNTFLQSCSKAMADILLNKCNAEENSVCMYLEM